MAAKQERPYHSYPFLLTTRAEIAEFLGCGANNIDVFREAGAPIIKITPPASVQSIYRADKLALRQWLGVRIPFAKGGADNAGLPDQTCQQARESISARKA